MRTILSFCQGLLEKTFDRGEVLLNEGEREEILYILIEGKIEVLKGDLQIRTASEPGAVFGEMSILLDIPHSATVKTLSPSRITWSSARRSFSNRTPISPTNSPNSWPRD